MTAPTGKNDLFTIRNQPGAAQACVGDLRPWLLRRAAEQYGFPRERQDQMWVAVWEALQNALSHGSRRGDRIEVRVGPEAGPGVMHVELKQPLPWNDAPRVLGPARKAEVDAGKFLLGGTVVMLWLADRVQAADAGRRVLMSFSPLIKEDRSVVLPAPAPSREGQTSALSGAASSSGRPKPLRTRPEKGPGQ
jgi:hypothetical protein